MPLVLLIAIAIFQSWRLAKTEADPDWAMFNFAAFTGSWYGRDFADCKTPGIHLYYWLIAKLVGPSIQRVKFVDHFLTALPGCLLWLVDPSKFVVSLIYVSLINSPHFYAFTGNVGHLAASLLMMSMISTNPHLAVIFLLATIFVEPKFLPAGIAMVAIQGWWQAGPWLIAGLAIAGIIIMVLDRTTDHDKKTLLAWIIESSVTIPYRMSKYRKELGKWMPWFTSEALLFFLPLVAAAVYARPEFLFWLPALLYLAVITSGFFIRAYHLIPLLPFVAMAGMDPRIATALILIDFVTCGFYLGDIWGRHYRLYDQHVKAARDVGNYLKDKPGTIWVNGMHSEVYVYARKPIPFGLAEQIEINDVATERREHMLAEWKKQQPEYVVITENPRMEFKPNGYKMIAEAFNTIVWQKIV